MKRLTLLTVLSMIILTAVLFVACGSSSETADYSDSPYVGTWKAISLSLEDESESLDEDWTLVINADGTGTLDDGEEAGDFTWEPTDDGFKTKGDTKMKFKEEGEYITTKIIGVKLTFEKQ